MTTQTASSSESPAKMASRRKRESEMPQYVAGKMAFHEGRAASENPFPSTNGFCNERYYWFQGYYAARLARLGA